MRADTCHRLGAGATLSLDSSGAGLKSSPMEQKKTQAEQRKARLVKALKANLARRKAKDKAGKKPVKQAPD